MPHHRIVVRRDSQAWTIQVWIAFGIAVFLCALGVWNIDAPSTSDRILLLTGYLFCLFTAFTLAKTIRDNQDEHVDTEAWRWQVRIGFGVSVLLTAWSLFSLNLNVWQKGFMIAVWLFMEMAAFTLAKTLRDQHDADLIESTDDANTLSPASTRQDGNV